MILYTCNEPHPEVITALTSDEAVEHYVLANDTPDTVTIYVWDTIPQPDGEELAYELLAVHNERGGTGQHSGASGRLN